MEHKTGGVKRLANRDEPVDCDQDHHPDGSELGRVNQRPCNVY